MADEDQQRVENDQSGTSKEEVRSEAKMKTEFSGLFSDESNIVKVPCNPDCPVCLQPCSFPVQLPCQHIFCFLCIKGVAFRSRKCALCRCAIPAEFLEHPTLVQVLSNGENTSNVHGENYHWFYEGRNGGWWQYDHRTNTEVNKAFSNGETSVELLIAGFVYLIDFENMVQYRRNEPGRKRRIKKDSTDAEKKGVAGIWLGGKRPPASTRNHAQETSDASHGSHAQESGDAPEDQNSSPQHASPEDDDASHTDGLQHNLRSSRSPALTQDQGVNESELQSSTSSGSEFQNLGYISDENLEVEQRLDEIVESLSTSYL